MTRKVLGGFEMSPNLDEPNVKDSPKEMDSSDTDNGFVENTSDAAAAARENLLVSRVEAYLFENQEEDTIDIKKLTRYLRRKFQNYKNKRTRPTFAMVSRAFEIVTEKLKEQNQTLCEEESLLDVENDVPVKENQKKSKMTDTDQILNNSDSKINYSYLNDIPTFEPTGVNGTQSVSSDSKVNEKQNEENHHDVSRISNKPHKSSRKRDNDASVSESLVKKKVKEFPVKNSANTFQDIGGNDKLLDEIVQKIKHIKYPEITEIFKQKSPPRGFLLCGPSGCGKTLLARAIAGQLQVPLLEIAATDLVAGVTGESEENLRDLFDQAIAIAPCVLFLDKIDTLGTNRENAQKVMEKRVVHQLCACLDKLSESESKNKVLVVGATDQLDSLDQSLRMPGRFEQEFYLTIPNVEARTGILRILMRGVKLDPEVDLLKIAQMTPGYVASELDKLINEAEDQAVNRAQLDKSTDWKTNFNESLPIDQLRKLRVKQQDFEAALKLVKPSVKKDEGFVSVPNVTWDDVGSLKEIREELQMDILAPVKYPEMYDEDSEMQTGVLLCGPPGCGKTLLAKAMANEAGINFISVKGPEFLNKFVGESEKNVRKCFTRARNAAPCIIFFDELDALCPVRSEFDGNATSRVVNAMLTELDGVCDRKDVFVMAATNRPEIIDPALLRSGRFDKILYVGLPKPQDRFDILQALTKNGTKPRLSQNVSLRRIAFQKKCEGFSGADLKGLIKQARREYIRDKIFNNIKTNVILARHFDRAFKKIKPTVEKTHLERYEKLAKLYSVENTKEQKQEEPNRRVVVKREKVECSGRTKKIEKRDDSGEEEEEVTLDPVLITRIKKYLAKMKQSKANVTITDAANHLRKDYKDYKNLDVGSIRESVREVFNLLMGKFVIKTPVEIEKSKKASISKKIAGVHPEESRRSARIRTRSESSDGSVDSPQPKKSRKEEVQKPKNKTLQKSAKRQIHVEAGCCT